MLNYILNLFDTGTRTKAPIVDRTETYGDLISMYQESVMMQLELDRKLQSYDLNRIQPPSVIKTSIGPKTGKTELVLSILDDSYYADKGVCVISAYDNLGRRRSNKPNHVFIKDAGLNTLGYKIRATTSGLKVSLFIIDEYESSTLRDDRELRRFVDLVSRQHQQQILLLG